MLGGVGLILYPRRFSTCGARAAGELLRASGVSASAFAIARSRFDVFLADSNGHCCRYVNEVCNVFNDVILERFEHDALFCYSRCNGYIVTILEIAWYRYRENGNCTKTCTMHYVKLFMVRENFSSNLLR